MASNETMENYDYERVKKVGAEPAADPENGQAGASAAPVKKTAPAAASGAGSATVAAAAAASAVSTLKYALCAFALCAIGLVIAVVYLAIALEADTDADVVYVENSLATRDPPSGPNPCAGKKPIDGFENFECFETNVIGSMELEYADGLNEQSGTNVTLGYNGDFPTDAVPIMTPYFEQGLCPVNVHWHLGAEHYSLGQYDETGTGPEDVNYRRRLAGETRQGFQCKFYDESKPMYTKPYDWKHCIGMEVGQTYEVHWPHSRAGLCGTINQYQTPFYDGVFCNTDVVLGLLASEDPRTTYNSIGVQAQVFTIVNDERYYYPDLMRGMIVDGEYGVDIAYYTGSTTGTSRNNEICSAYTPITWQVDRQCHMVSASSFDKMCADMKAQRDDMSDDLYAHGSRELVDDALAADNQV